MLTYRIRQLDELINEKWLRIHTAEWHQVHFKERPDFRGYAPSSYRDWRIIRRHLIPKGSFVDYGAGLGRVTILAGRLPFERVIGIDIDPDLVKRGNQNIARARGLRCPIELLCRDATVFDIPANATTLYFCNPFSGAVLVNVLEKVQGRDLQLVCNVPHRSGFEDEISRVDWLKLRKQTQLTDQRRCLIFTP